MSTAKQVATVTDAAGLDENVALDRTTIVREQSALFPTRLALARWSMGGDFPQLHSGAKLPLRAAWYGQATRNFQGWLEAGGFAQHDEGEMTPEVGHAPALFDIAAAAPRPPVDDGAAERADACVD
ncbi:MAG TPA: hypothetical protein VF861_08215 [Telluria sp.]